MILPQYDNGEAFSTASQHYHLKHRQDTARDLGIVIDSQLCTVGSRCSRLRLRLLDYCNSLFYGISEELMNRFLRGATVQCELF